MARQQSLYLLPLHNAAAQCCSSDYVGLSSCSLSIDSRAMLP